MGCPAFRADEDAPEMGMTFGNTDKRGMKTPVVSAGRTDTEFFMQDKVVGPGSTHGERWDVLDLVVCLDPKKKNYPS